MIFYFTGTGNSSHAAKTIAAGLADRAVAIAAERAVPDNRYEYALGKDDYLGFVFPIHAWGVPNFVTDFIRAMKIVGGTPYVFTVSTCGAETGDAAKTVAGLLKTKNLPLDGIFAIAMPNNYVLGYDLESPAEQEAIRDRAELRLAEITARIGRRERGARMLLQGKNPAFRTAVIHPLFNKFAITTKPFFATDACIRCGLCVRVCPVHTIQLAPLPVWGADCTQCLACISRCPVAAIQYGKHTLGKRRYVHPDLRP